MIPRPSPTLADRVKDGWTLGPTTCTKRVEVMEKVEIAHWPGFKMVGTERFEMQPCAPEELLP